MAKCEITYYLIFFFQCKLVLMKLFNLEKIDPLADGVFIEEKEVKCYMACIMKMANTVRKIYL